jgi:trehalose 6-phosphate phosphatase
MSRPPPQPRTDWALFLDIDGTLINLASHPDGVIIPETLTETLAAVSHALNGALALVSGRTILGIGELPFAAGRMCAAEHGAVIRMADGSLRASGIVFPDGWMRRAQALVRDWPGAWVEEKSCGYAFHYRQAPESQPAMRAMAQAMAAENSGFEMLLGNNVVEIRHCDLNKGAAVRFFMERPPFADRIPVFVGDDVSDEDGFAAVRAMGGIALHVAHDFGGKTEAVREWLARFRGVD